MYARILVPIDGSPTANAGLDEAIRLALKLDATLVLLHVVNERPLMLETATAASFDEIRRQMLADGDRLLEDAARRALDAGVSSESAIKELTAGRVSDVIVREVARRGCDLVVMGTHGRRGVSRLIMGSDAELVVRESAVPVLMVRDSAARRALDLPAADTAGAH
ncbi:MAG: universal stress protein [Mitsuaria chitosanitabida]|uniref:universal stress protein n=1 Tax=Roseateles chitosanitabidus TaxID=65048 RepID=UPI001AFE1C36|nr:universal stress protein [Roseateles chitosanitabidus]MBO9685678.1 universal stress protein [Roseateles chitosanitabidus]